VLDTDGVNAFAAPGGFVHVTRGALALLNSEAELAGVLGHEIVHITEKHTIEAIKKGKATDFGIDLGSDMAPGGGLGKAALSKLADKTFDMVMAGFGRGEELESDRLGVALANKVGYAPQGLGTFLTTLAERNKASIEKQGLFASHPEMKERLDTLAAIAAAQKPAGTATLEERYRRHIAYEPRSQAEIAQVTGGAAGLAGGGKPAASTEPKKEGQASEEKEKKKRGFGLGNLTRPGGDEKKSAQVTGSGAGRGVDTERNAEGGGNPALVSVRLTPQDLEAFKKEGELK
jgi:predicted Zn-dependent protease